MHCLISCSYKNDYKQMFVKLDNDYSSKITWTYLNSISRDDSDKNWGKKLVKTVYLILSIIITVMDKCNYHNALRKLRSGLTISHKQNCVQFQGRAI